MVPLNIYYQNVRGLRTKTNSFLRNVYLNSYDIISLTETWLLNSISDSELFDARYLVWRRDRDYARTGQSLGGGVLLAVRRDLVAAERAEWRSSAEDIWITLKVPKSRSDIPQKIHLCTIYLCDENRGHSFKTQLLNFSDKLTELILSHPQDRFIVLGDFNLKDYITWLRTGTSAELSPTNITSENIRSFVDTLNACNLNQYNSEVNCNNRILDLVFSNECLLVKACPTPLVPEDRHHKSLFIEASFFAMPNLNDKPRSIFVYSKGDYDSITNELNDVDWRSFLGSSTLDEAVSFFYNKLYELRTKHIPQKMHKSNHFPPWYNSALKKLLKEKYKFFKKYKTYGNLSDYQSFSMLRQRAIIIEKESFKSYITKIEKSIIDNPKNFWSYIKSKNKSNAYPNILKYKNNEAFTGIEISNLFADYFLSTFLDPANTDSYLDISDQLPTEAHIASIEICPSVVLKLLKSLDLTKSGGPDDIPPFYIVNCADSLVEPVCLLFKRSVSEGIVPKIWKSALVTPIHKKGDKSNVENYRPISKLCLFAKLFEKIVYNQVYSALKSYLSADQHGFLKKRSTTTNLLIANEIITEGMDNRQQIDIVYTDYSKCFDRIDHSTLLLKLSNIGIHGDLFRWFSSYIDRRSQAVVLNGYKSHWSFIPSGVPQGSLLGPLLFIIFVNDIKHCFIHSRILLFADDMKILKVVNDISDAKLLQDDLHRFDSYCARNKLDLNISKCYVMTFSRKYTTIDVGYTLRNQIINRVENTRDLGVIFDNHLKFDLHIDSIVTKASKALGFVMRTSHSFNDIKVVKILYCAFVRSHLEYASQVWNPQYEVYKSRIEGIQKKFLRYLDFKTRQRSIDYKHRCKKYHFLPLESRRNINDTTFLFNLANASIDCPELLSKVHLRTNQLGFRQRSLLHVPFSRTNFRKNSFLTRVSRTFNRLSIVNDFDLFCSSVSTVRRVLASDFFND